MSKRILSLVLTLTLVLGSFSMAFADHADTTLTRDEKIEYLKKEGFIVGNESGDDMLDAKIDRASVARILARTVLGGTGQTPAEIEAEIAKSNYKGVFKDVPVSHWANAPVNIVTEKQITVGTGQGEFSPARNITYVEVIAMMNRILGLDVKEGNDWNMNKVYNIAAARDAGILEGIDFDGFNYDDVALRGVIFELLYNTVARHEVGNYQIDKVIVLENNRVETLKENEIVVEVMDEVQRANFIGKDSDERRGEQLKITIPSDIKFDAEDYLGKVIELSYDSRYNAVSAIVDNSYDYIVGPMELKSKSLTVDGSKYTVLKDDRYDKNDGRILSTYINNESFSYEDAVGEVDFGRATVKNGRVLFVDAFTFEDVAPVKEVKKDGKEIVVYNDMTDGGEKTIKLDDQKIVSFEDGSLHQMDKEGIEKLDVIHVSKDNNAVLVRKDAQVNGEYEEIVERKDETVVVIDGEEFEILAKDYKKPVYSTDNEKFNTLEKTRASVVLKGFKGETVTILRDVNGNLQYIGAEIEFGEFIGLVDQQLGKDVRILKADNSKEIYTKTFGGEIEDVAKEDLVYVSADKSEIETMKNLTKSEKKSIALDKVKGLTLVKYGEEDLRAFDRTNVFVTTGNKMYATDIDDVRKNAENKDSLEGYIITDAEYALKADSRYTHSGSSDIAHTIVFTNAVMDQDLDYKNAEVKSISNNNESIVVEYSNGETKTFAIDKNSDAFKDVKNVKVGEIVELGLDKDDNDVLEKINKIELSEGNVIEEKTSNTVTINGKVYYITDETDNFAGNLEKGKVIAINTAGNTDVLNVIAKSSIVTPDDGVVSLTNAGEKLIEVEGKVLALDAKVRLVDHTGKDSDGEYKWNTAATAIGGFDVATELKKGDRVLLSTNKNGVVTEIKRTEKALTDEEQDALDRANAEKALADANKAVTDANLVETDYTAESYKALTDAQALPEETTKEINDKAEAIEKALEGLDKKEEEEKVTAKITAQMDNPLDLEGKTKMIIVDLEGIKDPKTISDYKVEYDGVELELVDGLFEGIVLKEVEDSDLIVTEK